MRLGLLSLVLSSQVLAASHHPQEFLQSIAGSPTEGEQIVEHFCSLCHAQDPKIPLGAPRMGNPDEWKPRLKQGLKTLLKHSEEGYGAMPARGGCLECSDEQLLLAIRVLIRSQKKPLKNP